jgi:hypothetical protein
MEDFIAQLSSLKLPPKLVFATNMLREKKSKVRFSLPPSSSRPAHENELYIAKHFSRHHSYCCTCQIDELRGIVVLCSRGEQLARGAQQLFTWRDGFLQPFAGADRRFLNERIELPDRYGMIESFLKAYRCQERRNELLSTLATRAFHVHQIPIGVYSGRETTHIIIRKYRYSFPKKRDVKP